MPSPKKTPQPQKPLETYGYPLKAGVPYDQLQFAYDCKAFAERLPIDRGCPTRPALFRKIVNTLCPGYFEWHSWTDRAVNNLLEYSLVGMPGCASSCKTFNVTSFACAWWMCDPKNSSVTLISTSKQMLKKRGWAVVSKFFTESNRGQRFGNMIDSRMVWQAVKGDDKHSISGKAVEEGSVTKVADDIKGVHTRRQMIVIDEATAVPAAIYEACANLYGYPDEFILVLMGNPLNRLDQFGRFCEPVEGWESVTVETGEWDGRPQESLGGRRPHIITFDAEKSPNITEGKIVSKHLPKKEEVEAARKASGGGHSPLYWQNFRGFWPPEGISKTVFSQAVMNQVDAYGSHTFTGRNFHIIGAFDHARDGGDRPMLRFAKLGETTRGTWGIEAFPPITLETDARSSNPLGFQLAEKIIHHCKKWTHNGVDYACPPYNFCVDATGGGADFCDILQRLWKGGDQFLRIQFGGLPSDEPTSLEDARPASEVYLNKRAEMYFRSATIVASNQYKGIDRDSASELVAIQFVDMRPDGTSSTKTKLMSKKEYKALFKKSPDAADTIVMLPEVAYRLGFTLAAIGETAHVGEDFEKQAKESQEVFSEQETYREEEYDPVESL